jgi:hypothetical protein
MIGVVINSTAMIKDQTNTSVSANMLKVMLAKYA